MSNSTSARPLVAPLSALPKPQQETNSVEAVWHLSSPKRVAWPVSVPAKVLCSCASCSCPLRTSHRIRQQLPPALTLVAAALRRRVPSKPFRHQNTRTRRLRDEPHPSFLLCRVEHLRYQFTTPCGCSLLMLAPRRRQLVWRWALIVRQLMSKNLHI